MRPYLFIIVICLALTAAGSVFAADKKLRGSAEWRYGEYVAEVDGERVVDASYFNQQYSLLYTYDQKLRNGRLGKYNLALGYEWTAVDAEINGESHDVKTDKVLYDGDLLLAPGGLPFRLHIYGHDMHRTSFASESSLSNNRQDFIFTSGPILDTQIYTNVNNGEYSTCGATLLIGIRNGSYMGRYRDVLSQLPKLLMDYRQLLVRDLKSKIPSHFRQRDLAFVSLNKKDNWFHFRYRDYEDFINPHEDYTEKSYTLGTIDHTMNRKWINLTNWIQISADGTYTVTTNNPSNGGESVEPTRRYDLNLFANARRQHWRGTTLTTYLRSREDEQLSKELEVPFFLSGEIDRNTAWRMRFIGAKSERDFYDGIIEQDDDLFVSAFAETFRQRPFTVSSTLDLEVRSGDRGEGSGGRLRLELASNRAFRPRNRYFASYQANVINGTSQEGLSVSYWENEVIGRVETDHSARMKSGLEQRVLFGSGTVERNVLKNVSASSLRSLGVSTASANTQSGSVLQSTTTAFSEYIPSARLRHRFDLTFDFISNDSGDQSQWVLSHDLRYDKRPVLLSSNSRMIIGDNSLAEVITSDTFASNNNASVETDYSFDHLSTLRYAPNRSMEAGLKLDLEYRKLKGDGSTSRVRGDQTFAYNFYTVNGIVRRIAEIREELSYERTEFSGFGGQTGTYLSLSANWYPTKVLSFAGRTRYQFYTPTDVGELTCGLTASLAYSKLQLEMNYDYGTRSSGNGDSNVPDRMEHRWEVKVRKIF